MLLSGAVSTLVIWWQAEAMRRGFVWASTQIRRFLALTLTATLVLSAVAVVPISMVLDRITGLGFSEVLGVTSWLFLSIAGFVALMSLVHVLASAGWVREVGLLSVGNALMNILGNLMLIPAFGLTGAAAATAASQCTTAIVAFVFYQRRRRSTYTGTSDYAPRAAGQEGGN